MSGTRSPFVALGLAALSLGCGTPPAEPAAAPAVAPRPGPTAAPIFAGDAVGSGGIRGDALARLAEASIESELTARCRRSLARLEPEVAAAEQSLCEAALTDGASLRGCEAAGKREAFERCFEGCLQGVSAVVDVVDNCEGPCAQIECGVRPY
jgi:hypothetical protein